MYQKNAKINAVKVSEHIVQWLADYAKKANVSGFVVGVSGGIDSAVTSTLCAKTGLKTLCVQLSIHQSHNQVNKASEHIENLKTIYPNVTDVSLDLTATFEQMISILPIVENTQKVDLSLANTRSRLRMTSLYYLAGIHGLLVAGTGNKVEDFGVGFYTKYGDGGVDLSPIADLMKSEVYALGAYLQVPDSILKAAPTDGLFGDNRTDEDQLGASYDELEWAMHQKEIGKESLEFNGREKEVMEIYTRLNRANQHKMQPIPVCYISEKIKNL
jgi:NAD+ synthase